MATTGVLGVLTAPAQAASDYPIRAVKLVIPFPPGGTLDTVGRLLAQKLGEQMGQAFIIENRAGGNGLIGASTVGKSTPDGYTLLFSPSTFVTTPLALAHSGQAVPLDVDKDFLPVALVAKAPLVVAINKSVPVKDLGGLVAFSKAQPGTLTFAIGSAGSAGSLATELLRKSAGMDYSIVPYKGSAPAYQDLIGGQITGFIDPILGATGYYKSGMLKILAVTSRQRVATLPDVPTVAETVPGYEFYSWYGLWAPAKMPRALAQRLNAEVNKALSGDLRERLLSQGLLVQPGSMEEFLLFQRDDSQRAQKIINEGQIHAE
jgi:tripartite-type tricarboxylate transporter receptor subunit TctC